MISKQLEKRPELILIPVFAIIYIFSLTFLYVEGDDAYSVMYHALGRNSAIERRYGPYQAMMDIWLSILPASETIVRIVGISLHAIFGVIFPIVIIKLIRSYNLIDANRTWPMILFALLLPFAFPEFIFFGLHYQCSTIALSFVLIAHLMLRNAVFYNIRKRLVVTVLAILLFAIGTCVRWDAGFYLVVMVADLILLETDLLKQTGKILLAIGRNVLIALLCVAGVLMFIKLEGYSLSEIARMVSYSQHGRMDVVAETSWKINIGSSISLFTPFFFVTFLIGTVVALRSRKYLLFFLLALSYWHIWKLYSAEFINPRRIINSIPFLLFISFIGFQYLFTNRIGKKLVLPIIIVICFIPWLVGVKVYSADTMWGPGFEMKTHATAKKVEVQDLEVVDDRVQVNSIGLTFLKGGFAVPFEGPRPVWGYFGVIFGEEWRSLLQYFDDERDNLLSKAIKNKLPVLQQDLTVNAMINLVRDGFTTNDKMSGIEVGKDIRIRRFYKGNDTVTFVYPGYNAHLLLADMEYIKACGQQLQQDSLYMYFYSSSILRNLQNSNPGLIYTYGPCTGLAITGDEN